MSKWTVTGNTAQRLVTGAATHTTPILPGRRRPHPQRFRLGMLVGALVVLAAWGVAELLR